MKRGQSIVNAKAYRLGRRTAYAVGVRGANAQPLDPHACDRIGHGLLALDPHRPIGRSTLRDCMVIATQAAGLGQAIPGNPDPWGDLWADDGLPFGWYDECNPLFCAVEDGVHNRRPV